MDISKIVQQEIIRLEGMLAKIESFMKDAPEGYLKWQNKNGKIYYYQQYLEKAPDQWARRYIKKKEIELAKGLAQKQYFSMVKAEVEKQLIELRKFIGRYPVERLEELYESLSEERKRLVSPMQISVKEKIRQWKNEVYEKNTKYSENLKFETEQGDMVRSKSEVIIANILYQNRKDILYKYERPLSLTADGRTKIVYPDFTILNVHTGRIFYWEHAGRMDDPYYANDFVKKVNLYIMNHLVLGKDLLFTFESQANPLEIGVVKQMVKNICSYS